MTRTQHNNDTNTDFFAPLEGRVLMSATAGGDLSQDGVVNEPASGYTGGVYVAVGDVNSDGTPDKVVAAGPGGGPHVKGFFAYDPAFTGGVRVATGDVNGDGTPDIITAPGTGGGPHVSGQPFDQAFTGGVTVAGGDVNGDGVAGSGLDLADTPQEPAMLLPAVQKVREAAAKSESQNNPDRLGIGEQEPELLLPAVQKVRDAAAKSESSNNLKQMTLFEEHSNADTLQLAEAENDTADTGLSGHQCLVFSLGEV